MNKQMLAGRDGRKISEKVSQQKDHRDKVVENSEHYAWMYTDVDNLEQELVMWTI